MRQELFRQNSWLIPAAFELNRAIYYPLHFNTSRQLPSCNMTFVDSSGRKILAFINGTYKKRKIGKEKESREFEIKLALYISQLYYKINASYNKYNMRD